MGAVEGAFSGVRGRDRRRVRAVRSLGLGPGAFQVKAVSPDYPVLIEPLPPEDGGGYLATVPDLPGCTSDGPTRELAARNVGDAIAAWVEEAHALGRSIPAPSRHSVSALG